MIIATEILIDIIIAIVSLVIGVIGKSIFDHFSDLNHRKYQIRLEQMVKRYNDKLKYYWPIYLYLSMSYTGWKHIKKGNKYIAKMDRVNFEKNTIIPLHEKICDILTTGIQTIEPDNELMKEILTYICHVRAYKFLRSNDGYNNLYPRNIGCPFPDKFSKLIISNLKNIQNESCELLGKEEDITKKQIKNHEKHFLECFFRKKRPGSITTTISTDSPTSDIENNYGSRFTNVMNGIPSKTFLQSLDYSTMEDKISFDGICEEVNSHYTDTSSVSSNTPSSPPSPQINAKPTAQEMDYINNYSSRTSRHDISENNNIISKSTNTSNDPSNINIDMVENNDP